MNFVEIENVSKGTYPLPHRVRFEDVGKFFDFPVQLEAPSGFPIISPEYGWLYGLSDDVVDQVRRNIMFLANSKLYVEVLLRALKHAAGNDMSLCDFLIMHCSKEVHEELGLEPDAAVFKFKEK